MDYNKLLELRTKVYYRIKEIIEKDDFELSIRCYVSIHEYLFKGILYNNGSFRKCNLEKEEEILNSASVDYADYHTVPTLLKFAFLKEQKNDYSKMTEDEVIEHLAYFMKELWRIHPFDEGNTRTTSVYIEKYLKKLGYHTENDIFKDNSEYVRNALVRASYSSDSLNISEDIIPLVKFLKNVINSDKENIEKYDLCVYELFNKSLVKTKKKRK